MLFKMSPTSASCTGVGSQKVVEDFPPLSAGLHPAFRSTHTSVGNNIDEQHKLLKIFYENRVFSIGGSRCGHQFPSLREVVIPQMYSRPIGPKNMKYRDPKSLYSIRERYAHFLKKFYLGRPFAYQAKFWRFLTSKTTFYCEIFEYLKKEWLGKSSQKRLLREHERAERRAYIQANKFNYNLLPIEELPEEPEFEFFFEDLLDEPSVHPKRVVREFKLPKKLHLCPILWAC